MFSVMQSPFTLREAETKKGRCSVSNNGPLTFPRQLDVVADAAFVARALDTESSFRKCWDKSITSEHNSYFDDNTAGCGRVRPRPGSQISVLLRTSGSAYFRIEHQLGWIVYRFGAAESSLYLVICI